MRVVLNRPRNAKYLITVNQTAGSLVESYRNMATLVEPTSVPRVIAHDPADDHVIAAAVVARADLIISGDKRHLLSLKTHQGIDIVSPRTGLDRLAV